MLTMYKLAISNQTNHPLYRELFISYNTGSLFIILHMHAPAQIFLKLKFFLLVYTYIIYMDHTHMLLFIVHIIKTVYSYFKMLMLNV